MTYMKHDLENMLREHSKNEAKLTEAKLKEEEYKERMEYARTAYQESKEEVIERMQLKGQSYDVVHSNCNNITDKTAKVALEYEQEMELQNQENVNFLENKIIECKKLQMQLIKRISRIENLLNVLDKKQNFIITEFYINDEKRKLAESRTTF